MSATIRTARFRLSQLLTWAADQVGVVKPALSVSEALSYYMDWCIKRGWRCVAVAGRGTVVGFSEDELWTVIWQGEDASGGVDLMPKEEWP